MPFFKVLKHKSAEQQVQNIKADKKHVRVPTIHSFHRLLLYDKKISFAYCCRRFSPDFWRFHNELIRERGEVYLR